MHLKLTNKKRISTPQVGAIHTNTIVGRWTMVKRGIVDTFHKVGKKYLKPYVNEFEFRYSDRMNANICEAAIKAC